MWLGWAVTKCNTNNTVLYCTVLDVGNKKQSHGTKHGNKIWSPGTKLGNKNVSPGTNLGNKNVSPGTNIGNKKWSLGTILYIFNQSDSSWAYLDQ